MNTNLIEFLIDEPIPHQLQTSFDKVKLSNHESKFIEKDRKLMILGTIIISSLIGMVFLLIAYFL